MLTPSLMEALLLAACLAMHPEFDRKNAWQDVAPPPPPPPPAVASRRARLTAQDAATAVSGQSVPRVDDALTQTMRAQLAKI